MSKVQKVDAAIELLDGIVSQKLLDFLHKQVILSLNKRKGRRYDNAFKAWAISLYHISGKAYRFLRKLFNLPSKSTLRKVVSRFASDAGFSEKSIFVLKQRVQAMPEKARVCTLIMDEISLKSNLFYDASADSLIGFESFGDYNAMGVTEEKPFLEMCGKIYYTIFDPPHLPKSLRNNLMKYNFLFDDKIASWSDIKSFFDKEQKLAIRTAPKLTPKHINPSAFSKMKVKLATQVFSHSVSAGIYTYVALGRLPSKAIGTAELLSKVDKIFDCCNSLSFRDGKICRRPLTSSSPHLQEIEGGIKFIKSIRVINRVTAEDRTRHHFGINSILSTK